MKFIRVNKTQIFSIKLWLDFADARTLLTASITTNEHFLTQHIDKIVCMWFTNNTGNQSDAAADDADFSEEKMKIRRFLRERKTLRKSTLSSFVRSLARLRHFLTTKHQSRLRWNWT